MAKLTQLFHEPGALLNDFVVNWSADNKVAVATQNSVCIYEVKCKPHEKDLTAAAVFAKILPEKEQNLCFEKDLPFMDISREKNYRMVDMFTDASIMAVTSRNDTFSGFRRALWSPPGMAPDDSCLLATLSWDRRLNIYQVLSEKPRLMARLSEVWVRRHAQPPEAVTNVDSVRQRAYELSIIEMVWTGAQPAAAGGSPHCHLVTVTRSGHAAVWRVGAGGGGLDCLLDWTIPEPDDRVTSLTWLPHGVLLMGRQSGRLLGYGLHLGDDVTATEPWRLVDETDNLPVSCVLPMETPGGAGTAVLLVKGFAVVAVQIQRSALGDQATVSASTFIRLEGAQVTGLCLLPDGGALASTLYNQFWAVTVAGGGDSGQPLGLSAAPISVLLDPVHYSCHALATSPSGTLICTVERIFDYFDHLVLREPVRVSFTLLARPLDRLVNSALSNSLPLHRLTDVLEAARLTMLVDKTPFSAVEESGVLASAPSRHLQCQLFMVSASLAGAPTADREKLERYAETLRAHLLRAHLSAVLERVSAAEEGAPEFRLRAETLVASETAELATLAPHIPACGVCGQGISRVTSLEACCQSGHQLPLCCQTAALCDSVPYRRCHQCGAFALTDSRPVTGVDLGPWCTFCDGRLVRSH